jgi:hypothetical protein
MLNVRWQLLEPRSIARERALAIDTALLNAGLKKGGVRVIPPPPVAGLFFCPCVCCGFGLAPVLLRCWLAQATWGAA